MILLNDILQLDNLENVKIRFHKNNNDGYDPLDAYKEDRHNDLLRGQFWNYRKHKSFKEGNTTIGLVRTEEDKWLLFSVSVVTKDLNKFNDVGYEYKTLQKYKKYFGRIIVRYHNKSQNFIRRADSLMADLEVAEILPERFSDEFFPGYENVDVTWRELQRVVKKKDWKVALENQKGVYLITDQKTGKFYVGSAYGQDMILGRWKSYVKTGHGGNKELRELVKKLGFDYIKNNFKYSILDIYKSTTDDHIIIEREGRWKDVLLSRKFGYNSN